MTTRNSRKRDAGQLFKTALDPCLLSGPTERLSTAHAKDKEKSRAIDQEDRSSKGKASKSATSRIKSLAFVDSPKCERYIQESREKLGRDGLGGLSGESSNSKSNESSNSTIDSFGSKSIITTLPLYDRLAAEKARKVTSDIRCKEKNAKDEIARRTSYGRKRKRLGNTRSNSEATRSRYDTSSPLPVSKEVADELWENIWGRWDQSLSRSRSHAEAQDAYTTSTPHEPPDLTIDQVEATLLASQTSQLSVESQNGPIEAQFSFYKFESHEQLESRSFIMKDVEATPMADTAETSRSRIDVNLLCDDDDETMMEDNDISSLDSQRQRQVDAIYEDDNFNEMQAVQGAVFRGDDVAKYFSPAWDGYQLTRLPPTRQELLKWAEPLESERDLYDYEDDFDDIPRWDHTESSSM